jgi:hypothetical protein
VSEDIRNKAVTRPGPLPGSEFSTIIIPDAMGVLVETLLFDVNGDALATRRTFLGFRDYAESHRESIAAQMGGH